jgi:hypothetical protein
MSAESLISIISLGLLFLILIVVSKIVESNQRRDQYSWALLKRSKQQWERAMNKALDQVEAKLK